MGPVCGKKSSRWAVWLLIDSTHKPVSGQNQRSKLWKEEEHSNTLQNQVYHYDNNIQCKYNFYTHIPTYTYVCIPADGCMSGTSSGPGHINTLCSFVCVSVCVCVCIKCVGGCVCVCTQWENNRQHQTNPDTCGQLWPHHNIDWIRITPAALTL